MITKNFDTVSLSMTREEYENTDFLKKTFDVLYRLNDAFGYNNHLEYAKRKLKYAVTITDEDNKVESLNCEITTEVYFYMVQERLGRI